MKKILSIAFFAISLFIVLGCDAESLSAETSSDEGGVAGYLIDSPIAGITYSCGGVLMDSPTDANGKFQCRSTAQMPIIFFIGGLMIGQINASTHDNKVYPQDLLGLSRSDFTDTRLIALSRLLQSLDDDNNYEEVINITKETSNKFLKYGVLFRESLLDEYATLAGINLVSEDVAIAHLRKNMTN